MKLYLYSTEDDEIVLNKTLKNEKVIDINFKASCNQIDTQVILNYKQGNFNPIAYNYARLDIGTTRYFFITKREYIDNENVIYYLHQDVYMSNQIIVKTKFYGVLDRSGNKFNRYINDENLVLANQKRVQTKVFGKSFAANNTPLLVVTSK